MKIKAFFCNKDSTFNFVVLNSHFATASICVYLLVRFLICSVFALSSRVCILNVFLLHDIVYVFVNDTEVTHVLHYTFKIVFVESQLAALFSVVVLAGLTD